MGRFSVPGVGSSGVAPLDPLASLSSHPMFTDNIRDDAPRPKGIKQRMMVSINGLLIAVVGGELRMTNLTANKRVSREGKGKGRESDSEEDNDLLYKTLHPTSSPTHSFLPTPIAQLVANPPGTVLALVSATDILVIPIPKWEDYADQDLVPVEPITIGAHPEYWQRAGADIVKVDWHPWGSNGSSLLVLTEDALLREFDISTSCSRPAQTISLLPPPKPDPPGNHNHHHHPTQASSSSGFHKSSNAFGFADDLNQPAVSFAIGKGDAGWALLTVYGLMENGDVWATCPYLPIKSSIPTDYVEGLAIYLEEMDLRLKEMSSAASRNPNSEYLLPESVRERIRWQKNNEMQRRYVDLLQGQVKRAAQLGVSASPLKLGSQGGRQSRGPLPSKQASAKVRPPSEREMRHRHVVKQGPFRTIPESADLDGIEDAPAGVEGVASDIFVLPRGTRASLSAQRRAKANQKEQDEEPPIGGQLGVIGIIWVEGKVDICIEVEAVEALWTDGESEQRDEQSNALVIYETIDLGLLESVRPVSKPAREATPPPTTKRKGFSALAAAEDDSDEDSEGGEENDSVLLQYPLSVIADVFDPDNVYIQHAFGLHSISTGEWRSALFEASAEEDQEEQMSLFWESDLRSEVTCLVKVERYRDSDPSPIIGTIILAAIPLPPSVIFFSSKLACRSLPLQTRSARPEVPPFRVVSSKGAQAGYQSLLEDSDFDVDSADFDEIISEIKARQRFPPDSLGNKIVTVNGEQLTRLATAVEDYRNAIEAIKKTSRTVEDRLELQVKESTRQLDSLRKLMAKLKVIREGGPEAQGLQALTRRCESVSDTQADISKRVNAVYRKLFDQSQPMISDQEEKWFAELDRMDTQINGNKPLDIPPQSSKLEKLAAEYEALKPTIASIQRDEERLAKLYVKAPNKTERQREISSDHEAVKRSVEQEEEKLSALLSGMQELKAKLEEIA